MKATEKILAWSVGGLALLLLLGLGVRALVFKPVRDLDRQIVTLKDKLRQLNDERRTFFSAEDYLKKIGQRTFGRDTDVANAQVGKMLTETIVNLGLPEKEFTRTPFGPRRLRGAQEVGWNVQGIGPLARIIDLLFVLEQTPQIHRVETVVLSAADPPGWIKARFRYLTLVIDGAPEAPAMALKPAFTLESPRRRFYDAIVQRDLLRPYIRRPASPTESVSRPAAPDELASPQTRPEMLKIVSLSEWRGVPEIHLCDLTSMKVFSLKAGDSLAGGQIVKVDYRALPRPGKPELASYSRLILKIGDQYWAVDHGQTLAEKYPLTPEQWPPGLPKL